jgi:hypothetical protein
MEMAAATLVVSLFGTCLTLIGILAAIYALRTWRNTLENQRADECLAALYDVVGLANRGLSLKEKGARYDLTWQAYWEAWNSQRKFSSAWTIVRRYHEDMAETMPEKMHDLLLEVEDILEAPVTDDKSKLEEMRKKLWALRQDVEQQVPRPTEWFPKWEVWADAYRRPTSGRSRSPRR